MKPSMAKRPLIRSAYSVHPNAGSGGASTSVSVKGVGSESGILGDGELIDNAEGDFRILAELTCDRITPTLAIC